MKDENTRRLAMPLPPESVAPAEGEPIPPADALQDALLRLHLWQEQQSQLQRLTQPNVWLIKRCLDEIALAQADAEEARRLLNLPKMSTLPASERDPDNLGVS